MNDRGQYGGQYGNGQSRAYGGNGTYVGASLVHTLELKQRYDNASTAAVQALLNDLSRNGVASSVGTNRWEIALKDGAWVRLTWYPDYSALEVTITDRELRRVDEVAPIRRRYEEILRKITPRLQTYGVTTVGGVIGANGVEKSAGPIKRGLGDVWNIAKYGAWAVLGIGTVVALSSVVSNLRSGKDPAEKYVEMFRNRRASRVRQPLTPSPGSPEAEGA